MVLGIGIVIVIPLIAWLSNSSFDTYYEDDAYDEEEYLYACDYNLQQLALALNSYHDEHGAWPPPMIQDDEGQPLLSWRALMLPYFDYPADLLRLDEPWDSTHNLQTYLHTADEFTCPTQGQEQPWGVGNFFMLVAEDADRKNLTSNDFIIVELSSTSPWTRPWKATFEQLELELYNSYHTPEYSGHVGGVHIATSDGNVRFLANGSFYRNNINSARDLINYLYGVESDDSQVTTP